MMEHKSSISKLNPDNTKQNTITRKPHNPSKRRSNCKSKAVTKHNQNVVQSSVDSTPSTLEVKAIKSIFPDYISDEHLRQYFSNYEAHILHAEIVRSRKRKYGLITFSSYEIAQMACDALRGQCLLGCFTHVSHYKGQNDAKNGSLAVSETKNTILRSPEVTSFVPSVTSSHTTASCVGKQSSTKCLHGMADETVLTSSRNPPIKSTLCVEGMHSKLPDEISDEELMKHFSAFDNDIISASIVRDPQTRLSAGYGIITFRCSQAAKKAQKRYSATHLCRKYQLRVTLISLTSSTILEAKRDEGIRVSINGSDGGALEDISQVLELPKKHESQKDDCSGNKLFASEADVPDGISLSDKETCSYVAGDLMVENLSCITEESELKALISSCGAEVLSCTILANPVVLDTCVANVSLVDSNQVGKVIEQLNDKEVYGHKLRVYSAEKKHRESHLHVVERKVSLALFSFITKHCHSRIKAFEEKGGTFYYQEPNGSAIICAPDEEVAMNFLLQVFNGYTEKTVIFKPSKWKQLTQVRDKYTPSLLNRAGSKFRTEADARIIPQIDTCEIHFIGTHEGVASTSSWLMSQLNQEIEVER